MAAKCRRIAHESVLCMKMLLSRHLTTIICAVFIATGAVSGEYVMKAVGGQVSFRPDKFIPPITSIIWKHRNTDGIVDKAIVWEEGATETWIPIQRFKGITTVDEKTGQITITNLKVEHSGVYIIDINSKEQQQRFTLTVMERVPKPVIEVEKIKDNPDVVYLRCKYSEKIIWKNSAGETLTGSKLHPTGQSITVKNEGNPENFYTCTLDNAVSEETSDRVYERDLFKDGSKSGHGWWMMLIVVSIIIGCVLFFLYKCYNHFQRLYSPALSKFDEYMALKTEKIKEEEEEEMEKKEEEEVKEKEEEEKKEKEEKEKEEEEEEEEMEKKEEEEVKEKEEEEKENEEEEKEKEEEEEEEMEKKEEEEVKVKEEEEEKENEEEEKEKEEEEEEEMEKKEEEEVKEKEEEEEKENEEEKEEEEEEMEKKEEEEVKEKEEEEEKENEEEEKEKEKEEEEKEKEEEEEEEENEKEEENNDENNISASVKEEKP